MLWLVIKILISNVVSIMCDWINFLYEWQTLVAGLIALIGALGTIAIVKHQINLEKERYLNDRKSKMFAARAALPDALSEICKYAKHCVEYHSNSLLAHFEIEAVPNTTIVLTKPPFEAANSIKESIEYLDPVSAKKMFELLVFFQIHNARLTENDQSRETIDQFIFDAIKLYALSERLFPYARMIEDSAPDTELDKERIESYIFFNLIAWSDWKSNMYDGVEKLIEKNFSKSQIDATPSPLR